MRTRLVYGTDNKFLRFYGDVMLTIGAFFQTIGLKYGGMYELDFDMEFEDNEDL
jgi:hypothetical protein